MMFTSFLTSDPLSLEDVRIMTFQLEHQRQHRHTHVLSRHKRSCAFGALWMPGAWVYHFAVTATGGSFTLSVDDVVSAPISVNVNVRARP